MEEVGLANFKEMLVDDFDAVECDKVLGTNWNQWDDVTIQRIVAGLSLSQSRVELSACLEVSFLGGLESLCQVVPMAV